MKAKLGEVNDKFDELFWFSRRAIVGRILKDADGGEEGEWHEEHDRDLIFKTWDTLTPLVKNLEVGWLKYLPRAKSPTRLTNPPIAGEVTFSHLDDVAIW